MSNGPDFGVRRILGIIYGGYVATAINLVAGNDTISYVLDHSKAQLVFAQPHTRALVDEALQSCLQPARPHHRRRGAVRPPQARA
jgi:long-subunit acyl-CoA synthetase (AMP-forming)